MSPFPLIKLRAEQLSTRIRQIRWLLKGLLPDANTMVAVEKFARTNEIIFAARSGPQIELRPEDWTFATRTHRFFGNYREIWIPADREHSVYNLERAYFHLSCATGPTETKEIIAVHCDSKASAKAPDYAFGLHPHVSVAETPVDKAHISLEGYATRIVGSVKRADNSLKSCLAMIATEILDRDGIERLTHGY